MFKRKKANRHTNLKRFTPNDVRVTELSTKSVEGWTVWRFSVEHPISGSVIRIDMNEVGDGSLFFAGSNLLVMDRYSFNKALKYMVSEANRVARDDFWATDTTVRDSVREFMKNQTED